jgi:hypothetical protein
MGTIGITAGGWFSKLTEEQKKNIYSGVPAKPNSTTTPIQTKFIVTTDKSLPNDKAVTINLKKGDILQGLSTSKWGQPESDNGGYGLTFTDKSGNKFSISTGGRTDIPFYKELDSTTTVPISEPAKSSTPSTSKLFGAYNKNLILVVLAVAGYFAYKKFKK